MISTTKAALQESWKYLDEGYPDDPHLIVHTLLLFISLLSWKLGTSDHV